MRSTGFSAMMVTRHRSAGKAAQMDIIPTHLHLRFVGITLPFLPHRQSLHLREQTLLRRYTKRETAVVASNIVAGRIQPNACSEQLKKNRKEVVVR